MSDTENGCPQCGRKIMQSISNRCMYCGADLPQEHHLNAEEKNRLLMQKMDQFKQNEENADNIISSIRQDFGIPERKIRKKRKDIRESREQNVADIAAAIASLNSKRGDGDS